MSTSVKASENYGSYYDEKAIALIRKKLASIMFERQEKGVSHNTLQSEKNAFEAIKAGKQAIRNFIEQDFDGESGILADNSLRNIKNNCICTICVLTRQILEERLLDLEHALSLSDACIQSIEECTDEAKCIQVTIAGMEEFSSMIENRSKTDYHHLVGEAKEYIFKHLHEKIRVMDIARQLKTNPDYLSRIFHQCEGITLHQYIMERKIISAKNMLQYSDYSNDHISQYLGFSSQSHLQMHFKKVTGMTLNQYRLVHNDRYRNSF